MYHRIWYDVYAGSRKNPEKSGKIRESMKTGDKDMNTVQRTRGIRKVIRTAVLRKPVQKHVAAGDRACGRLMLAARARRRTPGPSDRAILAWAQYDLAREIMGGFWEVRAA